MEREYENDMMQYDFLLKDYLEKRDQYRKMSSSKNLTRLCIACCKLELILLKENVNEFSIQLFRQFFEYKTDFYLIDRSALVARSISLTCYNVSKYLLEDKQIEDALFWGEKAVEYQEIAYEKEGHYSNLELLYKRLILLEEILIKTLKTSDLIDCLIKKQKCKDIIKRLKV